MSSKSASWFSRFCQPCVSLFRKQAGVLIPSFLLGGVRFTKLSMSRFSGTVSGANGPAQPVIPASTPGRVVGPSELGSGGSESGHEVGAEGPTLWVVEEAIAMLRSQSLGYR